METKLSGMKKRFSTVNKRLPASKLQNRFCALRNFYVKYVLHLCLRVRQHVKVLLQAAQG